MATHVHPADLLVRLDETRVRVDNPYGVPVMLLAGLDVHVEPDGIEQLLSFLSITETLSALWKAQTEGRAPAFFGDSPGELRRVVLTPDFHRGGGIPVGTVADAHGFVVPGAIGNDVCCGMRLLYTDVRRDEIEPHMDALQNRLRGIFFGGERDIPMSPRQREALLRDGLPGLAQTSEDNRETGLWRYYDRAQQQRDLAKVHFGGGLPARGVFSFADYIRGSGARDGRDAQIGSVGGGNHFVELQVVEDLHDGATAHAWGVGRDAVTIMVHSGSVGLGHAVGGHFDERARALYPKGVAHPDHGFYFLPTEGPHAEESGRYLDAMRNAANFAFGNRLFLGLMMVRALSEVLGRRVAARLIYDAPHNLIWEESGGSMLHRTHTVPILLRDSHQRALGGTYRNRASSPLRTWQLLPRNRQELRARTATLSALHTAVLLRAASVRPAIAAAQHVGCRRLQIRLRLAAPVIGPAGRTSVTGHQRHREGAASERHQSSQQNAYSRARRGDGGAGRSLTVRAARVHCSQKTIAVGAAHKVMHRSPPVRSLRRYSLQKGIQIPQRSWHGSGDAWVSCTSAE